MGGARSESESEERGEGARVTVRLPETELVSVGATTCELGHRKDTSRAPGAWWHPANLGFELRFGSPGANRNKKSFPQVHGGKYRKGGPLERAAVAT
mmetsp:Transcript_24888/g.42918  ORF Transcript_24888/g.42918 Transcript_24888/m.42918 type:complete len:97 (+) Transcript_24888:404-694(+)